MNDFKFERFEFDLMQNKFCFKVVCIFRVVVSKVKSFDSLLPL